MKKIILLLPVILLLASCGEDSQQEENVSFSGTTEENYVVGGKENNFLNVYGNILNNSLKTSTSNINGKIVYLACEEGQKVSTRSVLAKISPDPNSLSYKNNLVQLNSLKGQLSNLNQIRSTTVSNFDSKYRQLELQKKELANQINTANKTIGNSDEGLENQLKLIDESLVLLEKNRVSSLKNIDDSILNIRSSAFNTIESGLKTLDEVFGVTEKNKNLNDDFEDYLGAKDVSQKNDLEIDILKIIKDFEGQTEKLEKYSDDNLSSELDYISNVFKTAADVVDNSIDSFGVLNKTRIDALYTQFIGVSNGLITMKNNFDKANNSRQSTILNFDSQEKQLLQSKSQLVTQKTTVGGNIETLKNNNLNLNEQFTDLENTKYSTLKELDSNILSLKQAIDQLNISFSQEIVYAGVNGVIKSKNADLNNVVGIGTPICTIVPDNNSLKLEVYSPNQLDIGTKFNYFRGNQLLGTGTIITESPVRNSVTQNYTYEGIIDFLDFKEGDYVDIKAVSQVSNDEIWIPINYVFPKLDGYYVNLVNGEEIETRKIEIGKMNSGEILIKSGLQFGDTLK